MFLQMFENYFDRVTKGKYFRDYPSIGKNFRDADMVFNREYNMGILDRPELYEDYARILVNAMRFDGAPYALRREVSKRLKEFFRLNYNVR